MKKSLAIYLSLFALGCAEGLPEKPPGWHCSFYFDGANSSFLCNGIRNAQNKKEYTLEEAGAEGMQCMPNQTFERYTQYVNELKELAKKRCK